MEPVGARTARAMAPIVAPDGPWVATSRPAAATIWSSSNFGGRATDKRIYVVCSDCLTLPKPPRESGDDEELTAVLEAPQSRGSVEVFLGNVVVTSRHLRDCVCPRFT